MYVKTSKQPNNNTLIQKIVNFHIHWFDKIVDYWEEPMVTKFISNLVITFFLLGLAISLVAYFEILPIYRVENPFYAIELAFNILLIFEVLGLILIIPRSVADSVGKQFEIISLILLRDAFKEFGKHVDEINWDYTFLVEMLPVWSDAFGAILVFFLTGLFYRLQKHRPITRNKKEKSEFIRTKKLLAIYLTITFICMGIYDIVTAYQHNQFIYSIKLFYTLLIFTDIFFLLYSLRYTTRYSNLFRYSSFALATIFLRFSLSAPAYFNVLLAVIAGLMVLAVTYIYNNQIIKRIKEKEQLE